MCFVLYDKIENISKVIPIIGGVASGGLTYATYRPMANKLKIYLSSLEVADPKYYAACKKEAVDVDFHDMSRKSEPDGKGKHKRAERAHLCFLQKLERSGKRIYSPCFRNETVLGV